MFLEEFALPPARELIELVPNARPIVGGFSSDVYEAAGYVIKLSKLQGPHEKVEARTAQLREEHDKFRTFLPDNVPPATFTTVYVPPLRGEKNPTHRVATVQPFIEGESLQDFLKDRQANRQPIIDLFERILAIRRATGLMADVAQIEHGFRPSRTPNILVLGRPEDPLPVLVDTNLGRTQRTKFIGPLWSTAMAAGTRMSSRSMELGDFWQTRRGWQGR